MADMSSTSAAGFLPTSSQMVRQDTTTPSVDDYANVFGPTAYNIVPDVNRNRKYSRLHIPDVLKVGFVCVCSFALLGGLQLWQFGGLSV